LVLNLLRLGPCVCLGLVPLKEWALGLSFPVKGVFEKEKQQLFEPLKF